MKLCSIKEVFGYSEATLIPWTAVDYPKYDMNVTVIIHHKGGHLNCAIRIISFAFYVDEAPLRLVHIQGRNTTQDDDLNSPILFSCWYYDYLNETRNQLAKIEN